MITDSKYLFGIDIGGTTVKLGLFSAYGEIIEKWEIPTPIEEGGKNILPDIAKSIKLKMRDIDLTFNDIQGIGIGVPGIVTADSYVQECVNINGWGGFNVAEEFSAMCENLPVIVLNDANAAAIGEMWQGGAKGYSNIVFVTLGTGVGGGIVVNNTFLAGLHGCCGEIGHVKVRKSETEKCGCGKKGCLEQYASATAIVNAATAGIEGRESKLKNISGFTSKDIFSLAFEGDEFCMELVDNFADDLGYALASISCVCDPDIIVIGGGVSNAGERLLSMIREKFICYAFPTAESTEFALARLGNDAGRYGAARACLMSKKYI